VELLRDDDTGLWIVEATEEERRLKPDYLSALPQYLTAFDSLARVAKRVDEAQSILALLGVRGMQDAGWDPYETTIQGVKAATRLHNETDDRLGARHLQLWIYGHIVEASAPYELLGNLARISVGDPAVIDPFRNLGPRPSPGKKIAAIATWADAAGNEAVAYLLRQIWDRELRNAIFHSDYSIHGGEIRLPGLGQVRSLETVATLTGRASAYHDGVLGARRYHLESYTEPKRVRAGSISRGNSDEELLIIVREGEGAVGLKDALTAEDRAAGGITFRYAKLYPDEIKLLDADRDLALLPPRPYVAKGRSDE
jgi:hypothetical protein